MFTYKIWSLENTKAQLITSSHTTTDGAIADLIRDAIIERGEIASVDTHNEETGETKNRRYTKHQG